MLVLTIFIVSIFQTKTANRHYFFSRFSATFIIRFMSQFRALILFDVAFFDIIVAYSFIILNPIKSNNIGLSTICLVNMQTP